MCASLRLRADKFVCVVGFLCVCVCVSLCVSVSTVPSGVADALCGSPAKEPGGMDPTFVGEPSRKALPHLGRKGGFVGSLFRRLFSHPEEIPRSEVGYFFWLESG